MKIHSFLPALFLIAITFLNAQENSSDKEINSSAIWSPGMSMMQAIRDSCSKTKYPDFGKCFVKEMGNSGASAEAIAFAKLTDNQGYVRDFKETGKVDIAYSVYPFRANENQLCFLVNGSPNMIDVDKYDLMPLLDLKKNIVFKKILSHFPNVSVWPGDRSGTDYPIVNSTSGGGQEFIFNYRLQDGCHACKLIGFANLGFNFDNQGKFLGVKIISVLETHESSKGIVSVDGIKKSSKKIIVKEGKDFNLILESNRTTGYEWKISNQIDNKIIKLIGKEYLPGQSNLMGSPGKEIWNFKAVGRGQTDISFNYSKPWEKNKPPVQTEVFHILVR